MYKSVVKLSVNLLKRHFYEIKMPALSPTMQTGTIGSWNVKEGDLVKSGEVLASIETDKAAVDFEVNEDTIIGRILYDGGEKDIPCGTVIAIGADDEDEVAELKKKDRKEFMNEVKKEEAPKKEEKKVEKAPEPTPALVDTPKIPAKPISLIGATKVFISPVMKAKFSDQMAKVEEVWGHGFRGSGPDGRIVLKDESELKAAFKASPAPSTSTQSSQASTSIETSGSIFDPGHILSKNDFISLKRTLTMEANKTVPHYQIHSEVNVNNTLKFIEMLNESTGKDKDSEIDLSSLVLKAITKSSIEADYSRYKWFDSEIRCFNNVNVSLHMGPAFKVFKSAEKQGMAQWKAIKDEELTDVAQIDTLDGTVAVRLNSSGQELCLNKESAFIGVSGVSSQTMLEGEKLVDGKVIRLYSTFDHRTIDGAEAAQWLNKIQAYIESPQIMLL